VNKSHYHQRFSLAHEFGHWTLSHDYFKTLGFGLIDIDHAPDATTHPNDKVIEQEADEFAGELLVPMQILKQVYRSEKNYANLGNIFDVSREVILISLMKHHLIR
jgi:Zn-dependent peptidase ImmA (M78 family)